MARPGVTTVPCPNCGRPVPWGPASPFRPFCSERCRLVDLGEWLTEGRVIPEPLEGAVPADEAGEGSAHPPQGPRESSQD